MMQSTALKKKTKQNNQKNELKKSPQVPSHPLESLEKEITEVISTCRSIVKGEGSVKGKNAASRSKITLETVAEDMTNILDVLKSNLKVFKEKQDSYSDVLPILEKTYMSQVKQHNFGGGSIDKQGNVVVKARINNRTNKSKQTLESKMKRHTTPTAAGGVGTNRVKSSSVSENDKNGSFVKQGSRIPKPTVSAKKNDNNMKKDEMKEENSTDTSLVTKNIGPRTTRGRNSGDKGSIVVLKQESTIEKGRTKTPRSSFPNSGVSSNLSRLNQRSNISNRSNISQVMNFPKINIVKEMTNPLAPIKEEVDRAIREHKTFTIRGTFGAIRRALLKRGWVEKLHFTLREQMNSEIKKFRSYSIPELLGLARNKEIADICKRLIKSKLLANHQVDLYYGSNYESYRECPDKVKQTLINRIRWTSFSYTNKQGLSEAARKSFWFHIPGVSNLNHPRSYKLTKNGETEEFIKDFNLTAAMSLLKWVHTSSSTQQCKILSPSGKIPLSVFDFAVNECYKFIKTAKHEDIDYEINEAMTKEWNDFLEHYYRTVHVGNHFKQEEDVTENDLVRKATFILERVREHWPYVDMDGMMNIWILKPTNSSQGVGIHMCRTLKYVLDVVKANPNRRYIIQKYIERPLLIYNTKFDIRQWFLISSCVPLTIWIYKQCYLRFSSQTYNLRKLHESIHLTNNSVQCKYSRNTERDITLPSYNMWDSSQLKNYLSNIGFARAFDDIIYPGMKESITAAVLMHQDLIDQRINTFELYGADFMVTEDFKPWLLEINSNPALHGSTPITAKMCPQVLEDVIKVVVDHQRDKKSNTGGFELIYRQETTSACNNGQLEIAGTPLKIDYFSDPPISEKTSLKIHSTSLKKLEPVTCIRELGIGIRNTLENLLTILKQERLRRDKIKNTSVETMLSTSSNETQTTCSV